MAKPENNQKYHCADPLYEEPWVNLPSAADLASWSKDDEVIYNQVNRYRSISNLYCSVFDFLKSNKIAGDYFEFGCHRARTFRIALVEARRQNLDNMHFLAFDSFEGMPAPDPAVDSVGLVAGALCTKEESFLELVLSLGLYRDHIHTFKGFFDQSLDATLQKRLLDAGHRPALITVDCDTYASSVPVLRFVEPFIQPGTVIYIRQYFVGHRGNPTRTVARAMHELESRVKFRFAELVSAGWLGKAFVAYED